MRVFAGIAALSFLASLSPAADKLTPEDRVEFLRGLTAEYANAKVLLPRSSKPLEFDASNSTYDKKVWTAIARESGPAARVGDTVQVTKVDMFDDHIVLQINGGAKGGRHWYDSVQMSGGVGTTPVPVTRGDSNAPGGTSISVQFHKSISGMKSADIKKLMAPILDFDRRSVTQLYAETLPPEMQEAIKQKHATIGMDREQVIMAMGQPTHKERSTDAEGNDIEDWVFGTPPGKISFITFTGSKVSKVKDAYAGLGTDVGVKK